MGTYVSLHYNGMSVEWLSALCQYHQIPNSIPRNELHTTLVYSKLACPDLEINESVNFLATPDKLEIWESPSGEKSCVLVLTSKDIIDRHNHLMENYDITWNHPKYTPHITFSYSVGNWKPNYDLPGLRQITLTAITEVKKDLNLNWVEELQNNSTPVMTE